MSLVFNKERHTYHLGDKQLTSVSKWISQFVPPFDVDTISKACAKKDGCDVQFILDKWEKKKDISLHQGNWVHESIEYYLKFDKEFTNEPIEAFKKHESENRYISEAVVHNDELAGTIDLIEVVGENKVVLHDFKTNGDLKKGYGKMLGRFSHLKNTPMSKYTIQLNMYKKLLEEMKGVEVVGMNLWHYQNGEFKIIKIKEIELYGE